MMDFDNGYEGEDTPTIIFSKLPLNINGELRDDHGIEIPLPLSVAFTLYQAIQLGNSKMVYDLIYMTLVLRELRTPFHQEVNTLWGLARTITNALEKKYANKDDFLLDASYHWLMTKRYTREEVAQIVSQALGRPISTDAWRKRVDRFVEKERRPKIMVYNRRDTELDRTA